MKSYRICFLTIEGHIRLSHEVECADDLEALAEAESSAGKHAVEVWDGARLVARVKANNAPLSSQDRESL